MSIQTLVADLTERSNRLVAFHPWDPYILGTASTLTPVRLPAGKIASLEEARWKAGRFPTVSLAVADAIFSKQKPYKVAVERWIRPFALRFGTVSPGDLVRMGWNSAYREVFGTEPATGQDTRPQHLSPEGRLYSIVSALEVFVASGADTVEAARLWALQPDSNPDLTRRLPAVYGVKEAMIQNIRMNLGALIMKLDVHVRRVLARHLDVDASAPAHEFETRLKAIDGQISWSAFQVDQIIWYTESASSPS